MKSKHDGQAASPSGSHIIRGENPEPPDGWSWSLTDYEIEYVRQFNVRPPRIGGWKPDDASEKRLDDEADGIRGRYQVQPKSRRTWLLSPVALVTSVVLAGAAGLVTLAILTHSEALRLAGEATQVEEQIND